MRKSIIVPEGQHAATDTPEAEWLDLDRETRVEVTSEDPAYPIESALIPGRESGWRAADPGPQVVRLRFDRAQRIRRVWLHFTESDADRTQEFVLRWSAADGQPAREVVRQQWTFSPDGSTHETEDYRTDLEGVTVLELAITSNVSGGDARATLAKMRIA